ncbi:MAG: hypothetical protein ACTSX4_04060 [Candidatus Helarchaeota archaeon]
MAEEEVAETLNIEKKSNFLTKIKMKLSLSQNIIVGVLLLYFIFFGWITNCGTPEIQNNPQDYPPDNILFVYATFFNFEDKFHAWGLHIPELLEFIYEIPVAASLIILILIGIYQSYRENFVVYGIKNNLWTVPFIILISWIWTSINAHELIFTTIGRYFSSYHGYLNLIVLIFVYCLAGFIGSWLKTVKQRRDALLKEKAMEIYQKVRGVETEIQ